MTPAPPASTLRTDPFSRRLTVRPNPGPDGRLTYKLRVLNDTAGPWHDVVVEFRLPAGVRGIEATGKPATENARLVWRVPALAPADTTGATVTLLFDPLLPAFDAWKTQAVGFTVKYRPPAAPPRLMLAVSAPDAVAAGEPFAADVRVTNTGDADAHGCGLYVDELSDTGDRCASGRHLPDIAPGTRHAVRVGLTADRPGLSEWRFTVTLPGGDPVVKVCGVRVEGQAAAAAVGGPKEWVVGRAGEVKLTVSNPGRVTLTNATLRVTLPDSLATDDALSVELPVLQPGESWEQMVRGRCRAAGPLAVRAAVVRGDATLATGEWVGGGRFGTAADPPSLPPASGPHILFAAGPVKLAVPARLVSPLDGRAVRPVPGGPDWVRGVAVADDRPVPVVGLAAWAGAEDATGGGLWLVRDAAGSPVGVLAAVGAEVELKPAGGSVELPAAARRVWAAAIGRGTTTEGWPAVVLDPGRVFGG